MKFYQIRSVHFYPVMLSVIIRVCCFCKKQMIFGCHAGNFFQKNRIHNIESKVMQAIKEYLLRYRHPPNKLTPLKNI